MSFNAAESAIVQGFQAFYYELLRQKEKALSLYFSPETLNAEENENSKSDTSDVEGCVVSIQKRLLSIIENTSNTMLAKSRISPRYILDAKYIMAVLSDEIFLNLSWEGRKFWGYTLLEKQLFQTELAGDKFFSMLDVIIMDLGNEEMAFVYLMALSLGFRGKYRDLENSEEHINWYKERLCSLLNTKSSKLYFPGRSHMIESCYEHTFVENDESKLPDTSFWSWCVVAVVFVYIVVSYFVWSNITGEITDVLEKIVEQTRQGPLI